MQAARRLKAALVAIGRRRGLALFSSLLAVAALCVWTDDPGLEARYISHLDERPVLVRTDDSLSIDWGFASNIFHFPRIFSVRWRGWIQVERPGKHRFRITSSGATRLAVDGVELLREGLERDRKRGQATLESGLHRVEIDFDHSGAQILFAAELREPRGDWKAIPGRRLFDRRPGPVRRLVRSALGGLNSVARNLVGTLFLLMALLVLAVRGPAEPRQASPRLSSWAAGLSAWARDPRRRLWLGLGALTLLFVGASFAIFPRVGSPFGWDDVRYLDLAAFDRSVRWITNRYAHVYLLDLFIWLSAGDAFLGARLFWSLQFGLVIAALAVSAKALGPRLQAATFGISLFLLFSQPLFFMRAGASVPDTTVGTLVMAAVALYLHRHSRDGPPAFEWQILLIGAITVWAMKSKELGVILLWLVVLFLFERGRLDWRGFFRRVGFWSAGVVGGLALLMLLDGVYFKDPLYGLRLRNQTAVGRFNFAPNPQQARETEGWMDIIAEGRSPVARDNPRMRYTALLVILAALVAAYKKRSIELRLLHFMPVLYVLMLMVIHVRATYVFLPRYLYPIVPVSCFLGAAAFHYLGLDDLRWREIRSPRFAVPAALLGFLIIAIVIPYETHWIEAHDFLPASWLESIRWTSLDAFVELVLAPVFVLTLFLVLVLFQSQPMRVLISASLLVVFLGLPFFRTVWELRTRRAWQRGETHLHGLRVFGDQVPDRPRARVQVSKWLMRNHRMFGYKDTCSRIVKIYLRRWDVVVTCYSALFPTHDVAFLAEDEYRRWLSVWPDLERTAVFSPGGELVLVRPSAAGEPPDFYSE